MKQATQNKQLSDALLILWAGGAALLSYSLVYALRKPYTAASFEGLTFLGSDYKVAVTTIQILGYVIAKFFGIKIISELKKEKRFRFFVSSAILAEAALIGFGILNPPYNVIAMFVNGLSLGCMWGVIFSFIEGRKVTDILASLLGVSMVFSSGVAKSFGLFAMNEMQIDQFWMPAVIGGFALPLLVLMGYMLKKLPQPTAEDIALRNERVILDGKGRKKLFMKYAPILSLLFIGNFMLLVLRDIKEDFLCAVRLFPKQHQSTVMADDSGYSRMPDHDLRIFLLRNAQLTAHHLAIYTKSVTLYCLPDFPNHLLRPVYSLFPYQGKCRILHCHD